MASSETAGDPSRDASPSATTGASTPRRKEKKRVGFHRNEGDGPTSIVVDDGTSQQQILTLQPTAATGGSPDPFTTPRPSPPEPSAPPQEAGSPITPTGAPDASELRRALTKILTTQDEAQDDRGRQGRSSSVGPSNAAPPEPAVFKSPQRPMRPVLRRDTSYDVHEERVKADLAEMYTGEREQRSRQAARERAHNLAVRVENYASPHASHRPSLDSEDDLEAGARAVRSTAVDGDGNSENTQQNVRSRKLQRKNSHLAPEVLEPAKNLVRAHTKRAQKHKRTASSETQPDGYFAFQPASEARSGAVTPEPVQPYVQDYVPKPNRYHGGILGSLLKLYNEGTGSGSNSRASTPAHTPQHSPPGSNAPSTPGSPRPSRPSSAIWSGLHVGGSPGPGNAGGDFKTHHKSHSTSSLALGELIKSSSTLMAPGSSTSGKGFADRVRQSGQSAKRRSGIFGGTDSPKPAKLKKPKQTKGDQHLRITRHIAKILSRHRYVLKLCRALMMYGAPTHRLEEFLTMSARILEIEGQFLYLPGCMIVSFDDSATHTTEVKIVRQKHGLNLGKLRDVHTIYKEVVHDLIGVEEATTRLDEILKQDVKFGDWARIPIYGLASASVAPFAFGGRLIDLPIIFGLGCLLGWMQLILAPSNYLYANVFEITAAIVTSFLARMFGSIRGGELFCFSAMAQSSIALILPGYMVLSAALELQSHNIVAGSVRMVYAMIYTLFLGYGMTIGTAIYGIIDREGATSSTRCNGGIDTDWYFLFVVIFTVCLCIINQAKWKQMPVMVAISMLGYVVNLYSATAFPGGQISNMLGAFTIGILANMYSRLGRHVYNYYLDFLDWWDVKVRPRFQSASRRRNGVASGGDEKGATESVPPSPSFGPTSTEKPAEDSGEPADTERRRNVGYGLAAAAMLPGIFVQVPGGLAAGGSLLAGLSTANQITRSNSTITTVVNGTLVNVTAPSGRGIDPASAALGLGSNLNSTAFSVLFNVIQVAIGITVGLFLSSLVVYPFGKRRSGLLSF